MAKPACFASREPTAASSVRDDVPLSPSTPVGHERQGHDGDCEEQETEQGEESMEEQQRAGWTVPSTSEHCQGEAAERGHEQEQRSIVKEGKRRSSEGTSAKDDDADEGDGCVSPAPATRVVSPPKETDDQQGTKEGGQDEQGPRDERWERKHVGRGIRVTPMIARQLGTVRIPRCPLREVGT